MEQLAFVQPPPFFDQLKRAWRKTVCLDGAVTNVNGRDVLRLLCVEMRPRMCDAEHPNDDGAALVSHAERKLGM